MSDSLVLNQHCIATSKKLSDILGVLQGSDWVDLSWCGGLSLHLNRTKDQKSTDRISDQQDTVAQNLVCEDWQFFDRTNGPLESCRPIIRPYQLLHKEKKYIACQTDHTAPTKVSG